MEKNDFLLYNEVVYRIHACRSVEELKSALLAQLKLLIPYTYASVIDIRIHPETGEIIHQDPFCKPSQFREAEEAWIKAVESSYTLWLSHAVESMVVRDSELYEGEDRVVRRSCQSVYSEYHIHDCVQMNIAFAGRVMARLALYRTRSYGAFTDQEVFYLRALANHINLSYDLCLRNQEGQITRERSMGELTETYQLTRREAEILELIFLGLNNQELLDKLTISKNTLLKHLQNLYRKCDVSSRIDLLKLKHV
ncbi:MAG: hypothetical protein IKU62_04160 [Ruminiclostridium sp.]|nr:hypothetical protein [Ruminiclostridium sp.]